MLGPKHYSRISFLILLIIHLISCSSNNQSPPPRVEVNQKPIWINKVPIGQFVGQSSYALRTIQRARTEAVNSAMNSLVSSKSGKTANVLEETQNQTTSTLRGDKESLSSNTTINTTVTISGQEIPVQFRILEFWKDREGGYVYVLIEDMDK